MQGGGEELNWGKKVRLGLDWCFPAFMKKEEKGIWGETSDRGGEGRKLKMVKELTGAVLPDKKGRHCRNILNLIIFNKVTSLP